MKPLAEKHGNPNLRSEDTDGFFLFSVLAPLITICGILSYVSGWSFLAHYYDYFGLSLRDTDVGLYGLLIHGLSAMQIGKGRTIIIFFILVGVLFFLVKVNARNNRMISFLCGIAILILIGATSWFAGIAGIDSAQEDAGESSSMPNIPIRSNSNPPNCRTGKLLSRKDNTYFIVRIHDCNQSPSISTGIVVASPTDAVLIDHYVR